MTTRPSAVTPTPVRAPVAVAPDHAGDTPTTPSWRTHSPPPIASVTLSQPGVIAVRTVTAWPGVRVSRTPPAPGWDRTSVPGASGVFPAPMFTDWTTAGYSPLGAIGPGTPVRTTSVPSAGVAVEVPKRGVYRSIW